MFLTLTKTVKVLITVRSIAEKPQTLLTVADLPVELRESRDSYRSATSLVSSRPFRSIEVVPPSPILCAQPSNMVNLLQKESQSLDVNDTSVKSESGDEEGDNAACKISLNS